eukprot:679521-Rhodomonas_salina.1
MHHGTETALLQGGIQRATRTHHPDSTVGRGCAGTTQLSPYAYLCRHCLRVSTSQFSTAYPYRRRNQVLKLGYRATRGREAFVSA